MAGIAEIEPREVAFEPGPDGPILENAFGCKPGVRNNALRRPNGPHITGGLEQSGLYGMRRRLAIESDHGIK